MNNQKMFFKTKKLRRNSAITSGFTLIELLVVLVIIGILATLAVIAISSARERARDAKRISDVKAMQHALEMYFTAENKYPDNWAIGDPLVAPTDNQTIMNKMPSNDKGANEGACTGRASNEYKYSLNDNTYIISYCLAGDIAGVKAGINIATAGTVADGAVVWGGYTYKTVLIGDQMWFAENLKVGTTVVGGAMDSTNDIIEKICYGGNEDNCNKYGGLYSWGEAMHLSTAEKAQGICPVGWHIPTKAEWEKITSKYSSADVRDPSFQGLQGSGGTSSTNASGLSVMAAGFTSATQEGGNLGIDERANIWSSTLSNNIPNSFYTINDLTQVPPSVDESNPGSAYSVRCVID